jgi:hypothetical protein
VDLENARFFSGYDFVHLCPVTVVIKKYFRDAFFAHHSDLGWEVIPTEVRYWSVFAKSEDALTYFHESMTSSRIMSSIDMFLAIGGNEKDFECFRQKEIGFLLLGVNQNTSAFFSHPSCSHLIVLGGDRLSI